MQPGPNPREISDIVVAGDSTTAENLQVNGVALSGMMYAWGQFIDHDLDLEKSVRTLLTFQLPFHQVTHYRPVQLSLTRVAMIRRRCPRPPGDRH